MPIFLASVPAETFIISTSWSSIASAVPPLLLGVGWAAILAGLAWIAFQRHLPPSRFRIAVGLAAFSGIALSLAATAAFDVGQRMDPTWAAIVLAVPFASAVATGCGIAWIAWRWRIEDPTRCGACGHALLADQHVCPECGVARDRTWGMRQARVFTATMIALACAVLSSVGIAVVGALPLDWQARLVVQLRGPNDVIVATVRANATVHVRATAPQWEAAYGPEGLIRSIAPSDVHDFRSGAQGEGQVRSLEGPDAIDALSPEAAAATSSWIAMVEARCAGSKARVGESGSDVETWSQDTWSQDTWSQDTWSQDTWIELVRPPASAAVAGTLAGPAAMVLFVLAVRREVRRTCGRSRTRSAR